MSVARSDFVRGFQAYHPFTTYSEESPGGAFLDREGQRAPRGWAIANELTADTAALFRLGKSAFELLPKASTIQEFEAELHGYYCAVEQFRPIIAEHLSAGRMLAVGVDGKPVDGLSVIQAYAHSELLTIAWQFAVAGKGAPPSGETAQIFLEMFLFSCLLEIDNALIGICLDGRSAVASSLLASEAFANALSIATRDEKLQDARKALAVQAAISRHQQDPKQKEKQFVRECWFNWRAGKSHYKNKAEFARDMMSKCEHLVSVRKVEDWVRDWDKARTETDSES